MNCHEFEDLVVDLARGVVSDSSVGTRCWAHAANCPQCADRLLEHEKLTAGFEALTAHTDAMSSSDRVEEFLRKEFRSHFAQNKGRVASPPSNWGHSIRIWISQSRWAWAGTAAALLLSLAGLLVGKYRIQMPTGNRAQDWTVPSAIESRPALAKNRASDTNVGQEHSTARGSRKKPVSESHKSAAKKKDSGTHARPQYRSIAHDDLATNFYALPYGSGLALDEGWEIVRVTMPRSALATLGVPEAGEASSATIKADLVLGEDGLARAIRFIE